LTGRAAIVLGRTLVDEEVHVMNTRLIKVVLEGVDARCIDCFPRKTVPSIYTALLKEMKSDI